MTQGIIVLMNNRKVLKVIYSRSDSYESNLGLKLLDLYSKDKLLSCFDIILPLGSNDDGIEQFDNYGTLINDFITRNMNKIYKSIDFIYSDIIKTKSNIDDYFYEYAYVYNQADDTLKVYSFGKHLYTIDKKNLPLYEYIFNNINDYHIPFMFDRKTYKLKKNFDDSFNKYLKGNPSIDEIKAFKKSFYDNYKLYIEDIKYNSIYSGGYALHVIDNDYKKISEFIISQNIYKHNWDLCIQLPFIRNCIDNNLSSKTKCEEMIKDIIVKHSEELINLYKISEIYNKYYKEITNAFKNNENPKLLIDNFRKESRYFMDHNKCFKTDYDNVLSSMEEHYMFCSHKYK